MRINVSKCKFLPRRCYYDVSRSEGAGEKWDLDGVGRNGGYKARSRTI